MVQNASRRPVAHDYQSSSTGRPQHRKETLRAVYDDTLFNAA